VLITVSIATPGPTTTGARGTAIAIFLGVSAAGWIVWMLAGRNAWLNYAGLSAMSLAGAVLAALSPNSAAVAVGCMAAFSAGARMRFAASLSIMLRTLLAFLVAGGTLHDPAATLVGYSFAFVGLWTVGLTRHEYSARAEQAERLLEETRRTHEAETAAAALAERARIARDLHDVLAHSLLNAAAWGGSHRVTVPHRSERPSADRSTICPSSNATVASAPKTLLSATGHHRPIWAVNTSNAVARSVSARISLRSGGTVVMGCSLGRAAAGRAGG
jgi:hypothetical protein